MSLDESALAGPSCRACPSISWGSCWDRRRSLTLLLTSVIWLVNNPAAISTW